MLAAFASTLDTHLNWGASYWSNDLYRGWWLERVVKREAAPGELVRVARLSQVLLIALALGVMSQLDSIQTGWHLSLLFGAGMGAVLVLRWLWERVNLYCEIAAIVVSLIAAPVLLLTVSTEWLRLAAMAGAVSLYGTLIGLGQISIGRGGPWSAVLLALAVAAAPLWIRFIASAGDAGPGRGGQGPADGPSPGRNQARSSSRNEATSVGSLSR